VTTQDEGPHDQVRDLLGELGASLREDPGEEAGPMPAQISARIEAALAQLPSLEAAPQDVVPLRRRRIGAWLAAAATVAVIAGGTYALTRPADSGSTASSTAADAGGAASSAPTVPEATNGIRAALPGLTTADFASQVGELLDHRVPASPDKLSAQSRNQDSTPDPNLQKVPDGTAALGSPVPDCTHPAGVPGRQIEISLDGRLAQLIVSPVDGHRLVRAYDCGGREVLATTTLP
jgi:hypothetical protein